jgi:K+-transporting ATPase ATPase A chain
VGKILGPSETRVITLYTIAGTFAILLPAALAVATPAGIAGLTTNQGAHGFSEILYAYASSMANNGQNFAGLSANSPFYNVTTAIAMLVGRFGLAVAALALAGLLVSQPRRTTSAATFPADSPLFAAVVIGTALIVVGLSYFPALALGPIVEQVMMAQGS